MRSLLLMAVALLLVVPASPGQTTGEIVGTVVDSDGKPLPGASIEATSANLQGTRTAVTGNSGNYRIPTVPPGSYKVKASMSGFGSVERTALVSLDGTATVNMTLRITAAEAVLVSGEAPIVDTSNTTTGSNYTAEVMQKLPLGRNYASVVKLQPGVQEDTGDKQGRGLALSLYGSTSAENIYVIDGINTTQVNRGVQGKIINNEFIQEVEVKTGGYQAEYGRATGGIINVITKSGGNEFHGDVFVNHGATSFRSDQVHEDGDGFNLTYDNVKETDYGADLGGYFLKDRIWFFAAYNRADNSQDRVPREATTILGQHFTEDIGYNLFSTKLTVNIAQGATFVATYFRDPEVRTGAVFTPTSNDADSFSGRRDIGSEDYAGRYNQLFGSFGVLTLQYSKHQDRFQFKPLDSNAIGIVDRTNPDDNPFFPVFEGFGAIPGYQIFNTGERKEYAGSFTAYLGNHEFKLGGDYTENITTAVTSYTGGQRVRVRTCSSSETSTSFCPPGEGVNYTSPATGQDFRVYLEHNFYTAALGGFDLVPSTTTAPPNLLYSVFLQDTWRVTPRLTVNLGVRWDKQEVRNADEVTTINLDKEWQPRIGLIYDWKGDGSTKVFASYGRFYYAIPQDLSVRVYGSQFSTTTWNYSFSDITQGGPGTGPPNRDATFQGGAAFQPVDDNVDGPFQDEFTTGVEMALTPTFAVGLKGMYRSLGNTIEDRCDLDYNDTVINRGASCALINPGSGERWAGGDAQNSFPWCDNAGSEFVTPTAGQCFADGAPEVPDAKRIFRGIELTARKAFTQNLWTQFSYLFSSLRGNYDGAVRVASGQTDPGINADYDYPVFLRNAYGRLYLDRPHQVRLDAVYTAPFGLSMGFGAHYRSGAPVSRYGWFNDFYPDLLHYVSRGEDNTVSEGRLAGVYEANLSLAYTFNVGPVSITPGVYVFNLLDRQAVTDVREQFNLDGTFCTLPGQAPCTPESIAAANAADPELNHPGYSQRNFERLGAVPHGGGLPQDSWAEPLLRQEPRQIRASLKISF